MNRKPWGWVGLYLVLVLLPAAISAWAAHAAVLPPRPFWDDLAAGLGMAGMAIVLLSFWLLGRAKPLSGLLGSDLLMQAHQLMARTAVVLLLLHPFFYSLWTAQAGPPDPSATNALRIGAGSWGLSTGLLALGCLLALVMLAVWRGQSGVSYERWRLVHSALALAVLGLGLHHTLVSGRYAQLGPVAAVWWSMALLALGSWLWVYAVRPVLQGARPYRISQLARCADQIWLLTLTPAAAPRQTFRAGQFAWLKLQHRWPHRDNPFSICNAPGPAGELQFLIKEAGDMTRSLAHCPVGAAAYVDGPHGRFDIPPDAPAVVLYAGGIGVAPLLSLLRGAVARQDARPLRLIYADKIPGQMVDVLRLSGAASLPDFQLLRMVEQPPEGWDGLVGRLDAAGLHEALQDPAMTNMPADTCHLVCGPEAMLDTVESVLMLRGVPAPRIVSEHFRYDFTGRSPRARHLRQGWYAVSAAIVLGLVLTLAWR